MAGQRIQRVITRRANLRYDFPRDFSHRLDGQTVRRIIRRAKYLLVELGSGDTLVMHLGMSGSFRVERSATRRGPSNENGLDAHDHVIFEMFGGVRVVFNDPRRFGFMILVSPGEIDTHATLGRLGPEPLAARFDSAILAKALAQRKTTLKAALLDQRVVAGLGNIYVTEALHRARLSPKRAASTLVTRSGEPRPALDELVKAIREVLRIAIQRQYRVASGFSRKDSFLVYDREGLKCLRRGCTGTIKRIVQGGRSTFYCPICQR